MASHHNYYSVEGAKEKKKRRTSVMRRIRMVFAVLAVTGVMIAALASPAMAQATTGGLGSGFSTLDGGIGTGVDTLNGVGTELGTLNGIGTELDALNGIGTSFDALNGIGAGLGGIGSGLSGIGF